MPLAWRPGQSINRLIAQPGVSADVDIVVQHYCVGATGSDVGGGLQCLRRRGSGRQRQGGVIVSAGGEKSEVESCMYYLTYCKKRPEDLETQVVVQMR